MASCESPIKAGRCWPRDLPRSTVTSSSGSESFKDFYQRSAETDGEGLVDRASRTLCRKYLRTSCRLTCRVKRFP